MLPRIKSRIPTTAHESFRSSVVTEIQGWLSRIASREVDEAAEFARSGQYNRSLRLRFPADEARKEADYSRKYDSHEPNAVFQNQDARWLGIVIENIVPTEEKNANGLG